MLQLAGWRRISARDLKLAPRADLGPTLSFPNAKPYKTAKSQAGQHNSVHESHRLLNTLAYANFNTCGKIQLGGHSTDWLLIIAAK